MIPADRGPGCEPAQQIDQRHIIQVERSPELQPLSVHPFAGQDNATRKAIDVAVLSVEDMIHRAVRQSFPRIDRADHEDFAQRIRIHLAMYALPRFDASRGVKISTFCCTCVTNQVRTFYAEKRRRKRTSKSATPARLHEAMDDFPQAADESHDRAIERLAGAILENPERYGLTPIQSRVLRAVTEAPPGTQMRAITVALGYASPTSLAPVMKGSKP